MPRFAMPQPSEPPAPRQAVRTWVIWLICMGVIGVLYLLMSALLAPAGPVLTAEGSLQLPRQRDGHFYVDGHINQTPVRFMIDTGASLVAISDATAYAAGLSGGRSTQFSTAGGTRQGRVMRAQSLSFGGFVLEDVDVGTGLSMESSSQALLGQNVLRHFDIAIQGDQMRISPIHSPTDRSK